MRFISSNQIRNHINSAAANRAPFFFALNYEMTEGVFVENPLLQNNVLFQFHGKGNKPDGAVSSSKAEITTHPLSEEAYKAKFEVIKKAICNEEVKVANLTIQTPIETTIDCREVFMRSQSPYQVYIPNRFVSFSPERFVKIENGKISANPMKGTIDASIANAEQLILNNPKEIAELDAVTQAVIRELSVVAHNVKVKKRRYIDKIESLNRTLLQVSSEVEGRLPTDYLAKMGNLLFSLLPAASITGYPKKKSIACIELAEGIPRGYYSGIAGYFDGNRLDTAVLIRFIEINNERLFFRSGGGITQHSVCKNEYQEALNKIYFPFV